MVAASGAAEAVVRASQQAAAFQGEPLEPGKSNGQEIMFGYILNIYNWK